MRDCLRTKNVLLVTAHESVRELINHCWSRLMPWPKQANVKISDCKKGCDMLTTATISKSDCYNLCETSKKLESNDISDCDKIEETSNKFITKDACIQDKAIQSKNPKYCSMMSTGLIQDGCYAGLASETKDKKICNSIKDETMKWICLTGETDTGE